MKTKIFIPICVAATSLLVGFFIAYIYLSAVPSDGFIIEGERELEISLPERDLFIAGKININTATEVELTDLPGIGPALAERIAEFRETNGPFTALTDLLEVSGIGERTLARFAEFAVIE